VIDIGQHRSHLASLQQRLEQMAVALDVPRREAEVADLQSATSAPDFWDNQERAQTTMRRIERLRAPLERLARLQASLSDAEALGDMAQEAGDDDVWSEAREMAHTVEADLEAFELERLLSDEHDAMDAFINVQAGAGGTEAQDWAQMIFRMIIRHCERKGWDVSILDIQEGEEAGIKGATLRIQGENAFGYLKSESGVHRLVRISPYDASARRHTSFAAVFVMPVLDDTIEVDIRDADLRVDVFRSSGAGGQHVNTTDSAVRITHMPTGLVVSCQTERSQHQNKAVCMQMLKVRLYELERAEKEKRVEEFHAGKKKIEWGSQIRSYVLHPYQMVKDHRTDYETSDTDGVLDGELDGFVRAFLEWRSAHADQGRD
jgi:peptide chain release factor 2